MKELNGTPIISPDMLSERENAFCVLICTPNPGYIREIRQQLAMMGVEAVYLLDEVLLKYDREQVISCYDLLETSEARERFVEIVAAHLSGRGIQSSFISNEEEYFSHPFFPKDWSQKIFVDCGAYIGDTLEQFIKHTGGAKRYYAIEADPVNFRLLQQKAEQLQRETPLGPDGVRLVPCAVGQVEQKGYIHRNSTSHGLGSSLSSTSQEQDEQCDIITLDGCLAERIDFIKADIEGYEYQMLLGAKEIIAKYRPMMAICLYHNIVDLYSIPLLIHSFVPEYHFSIAQHSDFAETILYCWCSEGQ